MFVLVFTGMVYDLCLYEYKLGLFNKKDEQFSGLGIGK